MARIKIELPASLPFITQIPIRITDLNYGGHVGNDTVLSIIHEARVQFLRHHGYTELNTGGAGLIMGDVSIEFKLEIFYGDIVKVSVGAACFSRVGFELFYLLEKSAADKTIAVAIAKTGMVCYDYAAKKIMAIPNEVSIKLAR